MSDYLFPQQVLIDILIRLPFKSMLRFRCVSKSWNSLITSPLFINTHLKESTLLSQTDPLLLLKRFAGYDRYSLHLDDSNNSLSKYLELVFPRNKRYHVVGSCNGVVCLVYDDVCYSCEVVLWNPLIRKELKVPDSGLPCNRYGVYMDVVGFGFDSRNDDYKVVRIVDVLKVNRKVRKNGYKRSVQVEVFSLNVGCWKGIDINLGTLCAVSGRRSQALVNGAVHWLLCSEVNGRDYQNFVLAFDLSNEQFRQIMLPGCLARESIGNLLVSAFENFLVVFQCHEGCRAWMMEEDGVVESWTHFFTLETGGPVAFRRNGELLIENHGALHSYDPWNQKIRDLQIGGKEQCFYADHSYVESLVLLSISNDRKELDERKNKKRKERLLNSALGMESEDVSLVVCSDGVLCSLNEAVETRNEEVKGMDLDKGACLWEEGQLCRNDTLIASHHKPSAATIQPVDVLQSKESPTSSSTQLERASMDELFSLADFESELSPIMAAPSAISFDFGSSDMTKESCQADIQAAWERVTYALSFGPSVLLNSQDVAALKESLKLFFSLGPQSKFSATQMETMHCLEKEIDQLQFKFKRAEDTLATIRVKKNQASKNLRQLFDSFIEATKKCEEELKQWSRAEKIAKNDKVAIESSFKHFQSNLG